MANSRSADGRSVTSSPVLHTRPQTQPSSSNTSSLSQTSDYIPLRRPISDAQLRVEDRVFEVEEAYAADQGTLRHHLQSKMETFDASDADDLASGKVSGSLCHAAIATVPLNSAIHISRSGYHLSRRLSV